MAGRSTSSTATGSWRYSGNRGPGENDADRALACALDLVDALSDWRNQKLSNGYSALHAAIGLHYGTVVGGVLDNSCHSEFTVIGDAVTWRNGWKP